MRQQSRRVKNKRTVNYTPFTQSGGEFQLDASEVFRLSQITCPGLSNPCQTALVTGEKKKPKRVRTVRIGSNWHGFKALY